MTFFWVMYGTTCQVLLFIYFFLPLSIWAMVGITEILEEEATRETGKGRGLGPLFAWLINLVLVFSPALSLIIVWALYFVEAGVGAYLWFSLPFGTSALCLLSLSYFK